MAAKWFFRLILNSVLGLLLLIILSLLNSPLGINLGINPLNAAVIGFLGLPGVALLLIARCIFLT